MQETDNLRLPYLVAAQAQKHVTHNEALRGLDAIVQLSVADRDLAAPPPSPSAGERYLIAAGATGDWAGHDGKIAAYQDNAWMFHEPREGWIAWVADEDIALAFDGTAWVALSGAGVSVNPTALVGINTTADSTNRLSVSSPAALFNNAGNGHQLKINKAAAADTASLLFQTGFSGRAEFGLAGDDDWRVKVSADGSAWKEAIVVDRQTGAVTFPNSTVPGSGAASPTFQSEGDGVTASIDSVWTKAGLSVVDNDLGDSSFANSRVTIGANDAGKWIVVASGSLLGTTVGVRVHVNGTPALIYFFGRSDSENAARIGSSSGILNLASGDYVELFTYAKRSGGANQIPNVQSTYLHMTRIGAA